MSLNLLDMARAYHEEMQPPWPLDERAFLETMSAIDDAGFVRITDRGFIAAVIRENPLSPGWKVAQQVMWYGDADLIRQFRKWAKEQGADEILHGCQHGSRVERFYTKFSRPSDAIYSEVIQWSHQQS